MPTGHSYTEKFWTLVNKKNDNECWEWKGVKCPKGYGYLSTREMKNKHTKAHRLSYDIHHPLTKEIGYVDYHVLHSCDNPKCVNPYHLRLGTNNENVKDKVERGRSNKLYGDDSTNHKLSSDNVREIRIANDMYCKSNRLHKDLAKKYNISVYMINKIVNFKNWLGV